MAINKWMRATLKALSYKDVNVKKNYKICRAVNRRMITPVKAFYEMSDYKIHLKGREIPVRIFPPEETRSEQVILFFHGGGWVIGDIDSYTKPCASLAKATGCRVLSVDYRLAPEHPFPCGLEDCYHAVKTIFENNRSFQADPDNTILMGDSAGGNLAAAVSLLAKERKEFSIKRQILLYPATADDHSQTSPFPSIHQFGEGYLLTVKRLCDYVDLYIPKIEDRKNPYFAPLLSEDLSGQPHTLIITAEYDPLRDEGEAYGEKLRAHGNQVEIHRMKNALHGFFGLPPKFGHVQKTYEYIRNFLAYKK